MRSVTDNAGEHNGIHMAPLLSSLDFSIRLNFVSSGFHTEYPARERRLRAEIAQRGWQADGRLVQTLEKWRVPSQHPVHSANSVC